MKIKHLLLGVITVTSLILSGFSPQQLENDKTLIKGAWKNTDDINELWSFSETHCYWKYEGNIEAAFTYSIVEEKSQNGKLTFSILILTSLKNSNDVYKYEINTLGADNFVLDYLGDQSGKMKHFIKS